MSILLEFLKFGCDVIQCQRPSNRKRSISHCDAALILFYLSNLSQVECTAVLDSDERSIVISRGLSSKGIPAQFYFRDSFFVYCLPIFLCLIIYLSNVMLLLQIKVLELHSDRYIKPFGCIDCQGVVYF